MDYDAFRRHYRENHRTVGCKIAHMFAVPLIVASLITVFFAWQLALGMFALGWAVAFFGHVVFEKNRPVMFEHPSNLLIYGYAVVFVAEEWCKVLTFHQLTNDPDDR